MWQANPLSWLLFSGGSQLALMGVISMIAWLASWTQAGLGSASGSGPAFRLRG